MPVTAQRLETLEFCRAARARGELALAVTVLDSAIAQLTAEDAATLARLLLERAELALAAGDVATADDAARRAGPLAQKAEDLTVMAQAAWTVGQVTARWVRRPNWRCSRRPGQSRCGRNAGWPT